MSTEIKNTLFRFATLRAPGLVSKDDLDTAFVFHPDMDADREKLENDTRTFFSDLILSPRATSEEQITALVRRAREFTETSDLIATKSKLKTFVDENLVLLSNRLSRTRRENLSAVAQELLTTANELPYEKQIVLWDNLFYLIVTQKNAALRDAIIHVLIADHFVRNPHSENQEQTGKASIVIPPTFFGGVAEFEEDSHPSNQSNVLSRTQLDAALEITAAQDKINKIGELRTVLKRTENAYRKNEVKRSREAVREYDARINEIYRGAEQIDQEYVNLDTGLKVTRKEYKNMPIPEFSYSPETEVPTDLLLRIMEPFTGIFEDDEEVKDFDNFNDIHTALDRITAEANGRIANLSSSSQRIAVIGGVPVASSSMARTNTLFEYNVGMTHYLSDYVPTNGSPVHKWKDFKVVVFGLTAAEIDSAQTTFTVTLPNGDHRNIALPVVSNVNGTVVFSGFDNTDPVIVAESDDQHFITVAGSIALIDGKMDFSISLPVGFTLRSNTIKSVKGFGKFEPTRTDEEPNQEVFVPSSFGIKNLGVADYRKVEQSICCYEPGEVSHIENIMAREYKEKSTERFRSSETTTTTSKETEAENLTDTTSTTRSEMHSEVAQVIQEDQQTGVSATLNQKWGSGSISVTGSFAHNTAQEDSTSQALTYAQDITERALERVVSKIKSEKISKFIESFRENNKHGFDNTEGDEHVSGVYRWINKVYNNQIVNYGKRAMLEFMIPEPARFHILASTNNQEDGDTTMLEKPIDPRSAEAGVNRIQSYTDVNKLTYPAAPGNYSYWAGKYNVEIEPLPPSTVRVSKEYSKKFTDQGYGAKLRNTDAFNVEIPDGYSCSSFSANGDYCFEGSQNTVHLNITYGSYRAPQYTAIRNSLKLPETQIDKVYNLLPVCMIVEDIEPLTLSVTAYCTLEPVAREQWQMDTFNAIIAAYEEKLEAYNRALQDAKDKATGMIASNPLYYRQIERNILQKNIVHYLVRRAYIGQNYLTSPTDLENVTPLNNQAFDINASVARFMEEAFEWDIMSYSFLPFYWGDRKRWKGLYNYQFDDQLFTNFMQAGMARVILSVRPGFEKAVNWYMATGQVWNGGQVPTLGDELYLSIDQEMRDVKPTPEGLPWKTVLPSDLTVIQSSTIGLEAQGLPCGCPDTVGGEVHLNARIEPKTALLGNASPEGEKLEVHDGYLQLISEGDAEVIAQIPLEDIKAGMGL